jgi:hypothetical protein
VHPEGFLVHRAHPRAPASQAYVTKEAGKSSVLRRNVTRWVLFGGRRDGGGGGLFAGNVTGLDSESDTL